MGGAKSLHYNLETIRLATKLPMDSVLGVSSYAVLSDVMSCIHFFRRQYAMRVETSSWIS